MTPEMQAAVEWVRHLYEQTGITCKAFAELCGVSITSVYNWINGLQCPTVDSLRKIGEAYGMQPPPHIVLAAEKYCAQVLAKTVQGANETCAAKRLKKLKDQKEPLFVYHWEYDGKYREFCKEKRCEWKNHNGICNLPVCMKEVSHADARKSGKDRVQNT